MLKEKIMKYIDENDVFILDGTTNETINLIEEQLEVKLPKSYKWFLQKYGSAEFFGFEIEGIGINNILIVVEKTKHWRNNINLPTEYIVIEEPGTGWLYCIDTSIIEENESPIIKWDCVIKNNETIADNLYNYILKRIEETEDEGDIE